MAKKKKSLKNNINMFLIFILILFVIFMIYYVKNKNDNMKVGDQFNDGIINSSPNDNVNENKPTKDDKKIENKKSYLNKVVNNSQTTIKEGWQNIITSYLDSFYKSLITLNMEDLTSLFTDPDGVEAYLSSKATQLLIKHHKLQENDMTLSSAYYNLNYQNVNIKDNIVTIKLLKDDVVKFKFLNGIESKSYDMSIIFVIRKTNNTYSLDSVRIIQDYYVMFTNENISTKSSIDSLYNNYLTKIENDVEENKKLRNDNNYKSIKKYDHAFDREKASIYASTYVSKRNPNFTSYDSSGGNCMNFASQTINAGGIPMDYFGTYQWKHYGSNLNNSNTPSGRTASWVSTNGFYEYAKNNTGFGLVSDVDVNIFAAEKGDVIQVGYSGYTHSTVAVKQIKNNDGDVIDILINCNTLSLENYPLLSYVYPNKRLIKILGYND